MGLCFFGNKDYFIKPGEKTWRLDELKEFLAEKGIAIFDTCLKIRRTKGTASDKDLEVIEQADLDGMLHYAVPSLLPDNWQHLSSLSISTFRMQRK